MLISRINNWCRWGAEFSSRQILIRTSKYNPFLIIKKQLEMCLIKTKILTFGPCPKTNTEKRKKNLYRIQDYGLIKSNWTITCSLHSTRQSKRRNDFKKAKIGSTEEWISKMCGWIIRLISISSMRVNFSHLSFDLFKNQQRLLEIILLFHFSVIF